MEAAAPGAASWPSRFGAGIMGTPGYAGRSRLDGSPKGGCAAMATVLVVEDERKLRDLVRSYLERAGFIVLSTGSGAEAIAMAAEASPDLVVLDLGLPDVPGEMVARELRASGRPDPDADRQERGGGPDRGLELGADDYVTKPFSPRELVLRVQAILRRGGPAAGQGVTSSAGGAGHRRAAAAGDGARPGGQPHPDRMGNPAGAGHGPGPGVLPVRADQPGAGYEFEGYERTVDSHVKNLRRKIEDDPADPQIVQTVLGGGYRLGLARDD